MDIFKIEKSEMNYPPNLTEKFSKNRKMEWIENKTARQKEWTVVDNPPKEIIF
jgi:hypothetical protein